MTVLRTPTSGVKLRRGYSFLEDFRRNYKLAKIIRRARFGFFSENLPLTDFAF